MYARKTLLITGGTGSFGNAVLERFLESELDEIRIFSRDEKKQDDMRKLFNHDKLKFYIGDVRDATSVLGAMKGVHYVFHAAALKQVPSCEFYPLEAVKTNVLGTENVLDAAIRCDVEKVVCLSTDKAVYPINAMGITKALMEKVVVAKARNSGNTTVCVTRYGNVMCSRGSVIPLFIEQLKNDQPITVTDPSMTRFMMSLNDAVDLVLFAFEKSVGGEIFVQKAPAATIATLIDALCLIFEKKDHPIRTIGTRHGEKLYESLLSREEMSKADDLPGYYRVVPDNRDLNYGKYFDIGSALASDIQEYTSHNTQRLNVHDMRELLLTLSEVRNSLL